MPLPKMLSNLVDLYRETFPKPQFNVMSIEYVAAIQEFYEFFPGYVTQTEAARAKLRRYYQRLRVPLFMMTWHRGFQSAMALDNSIEEWLEQNPDKRTKGLSGEFAVAILADHDEKVIEKYLEYKAMRLAKLSRTTVERRKRANQLIARTNFDVKWLLGREAWASHERDIQEKYRKKFEAQIRDEVRKELGLLKAE